MTDRFGVFGVRLSKDLGNHKVAVTACLRAGDLVGAAQSCEADARRLAPTEPAKAEQRLQEALRHYKKAKQHLQGFHLLQRHPSLTRNMPPEVRPATSYREGVSQLTAYCAAHM